MKKNFLVIFLILIIITPTIWASNDQSNDESWIAAYQYKKNLSDKDKYYPFVEIRDRNFLIYQTGSATRNIMADYIIVQAFQTIKTTDFSTISTSANLLNTIRQQFISVQTVADYQKRVLELKAILILKKEFTDKENFLKTYLGLDVYQKFYYDFYHFQVIKTETSVPKNTDWKNSKNNFTNPEIKKIINDIQAEYLSGAYNTKIEVTNGALRDSVKASERLNSMMPIYPNQINIPNSPFVSMDEAMMDNNLKRALLNNLKDQIRFDWVYKVNLLTLKVDKAIIGDIESFFNLFDDSLLITIQNENKNRFGNFDVSFYDKNNLTNLLKNQLKI